MTNMKKITLAALLMTSASAFAGINVGTDQNGAWVKVKDAAGTPAAGVEVVVSGQDGTFYTNDKGRVYVPIDVLGTRSLEATAKHDSGMVESTQFLFTNSH